MHKLTRIAYNSANWQRPTGEARQSEVAGTYNHTNGFGHEDWLFRSEWLIDGWRYAFIQGVNKSHARLVKEGQSVDLTLFTIQPDKQRRYIATIGDLECLDDDQAADALKAFQERGWHATMLQEIEAVGGNAAALGDAKWARHVLNVRFRLEKVTPSPPASFAKAGDPVLKLMRYQLYDEMKIGKSPKAMAKAMPSGSTTPPNTASFWKSGTGGRICTPEHAKMQETLMAELNTEFPGCKVEREVEFIDIRVETASEILLFEIKSDLEPRTVIRQALGQILEYAFHPAREHVKPVRLFIVGRQKLAKADAAYLDRLRSEFALPIEYRVVAL
jgi:hypothetical protein